MIYASRPNLRQHIRKCRGFKASPAALACATSSILEQRVRADVHDSVIE